MNQVTITEASDYNWKSLYRVGGVATLLMFVLTLVQGLPKSLCHMDKFYPVVVNFCVITVVNFSLDKYIYAFRERYYLISVFSYVCMA